MAWLRFKSWVWQFLFTDPYHHNRHACDWNSFKELSTYWLFAQHWFIVVCCMHVRVHVCIRHGYYIRVLVNAVSWLKIFPGQIRFQHQYYTLCWRECIYTCINTITAQSCKETLQHVHELFHALMSGQITVHTQYLWCPNSKVYI